LNKFLRKIERFFLYLIMIALILVLSIQIIMQDNDSYLKLKKYEYTIRNFFNKRAELVEVIDKKKTGLIIIDLLQSKSLPQVYILKNNKRVSNFSKGYVILDVRDGDFIEIDASNYKNALWFEITEINKNISSLKKGKQFRIENNKIALGVIKFNNKI